MHELKPVKLGKYKMGQVIYSELVNYYEYIEELIAEYISTNKLTEYLKKSKLTKYFKKVNS
jgi:hypothetical protein